MAEKTSKSESPEITPYLPFAQLQQAGMGGFQQMNVVWLETIGNMGAEVMSFLSDRIKEDVKTQHQLLHCKNIDEARRIQESFVEKAIDQYQAETGKLVEMGMSAFQAGNGNSQP